MNTHTTVAAFGCVTIHFSTAVKQDEITLINLSISIFIDRMLLFFRKEVTY
jgi:hypothetical protein